MGKRDEKRKRSPDLFEVLIGRYGSGLRKRLSQSRGKYLFSGFLKKGWVRRERYRVGSSSIRSEFSQGCGHLIVSLGWSLRGGKSGAVLKENLLFTSSIVKRGTGTGENGFKENVF